MPGREENVKIWESLWERIDAFTGAISRSGALNVNSADLRQHGREVVLYYFREIKPALTRLGVTGKTLEQLDSEMQRLIGLASGKNSKATYQKLIRKIKAHRKEVETGLEFLIGAEAPALTQLKIGNVESAILNTLETMLPTVAASYRQALLDIQDPRRISYRGPAAEIREVVREVLDHLAPDEDVMKSAGFKLEKDQTGPTMKQKVRFILRARAVGDSARSTAESSVEHLNENVGSVGRAVYTRGSTAVHIPKPREEVLNFKLYADAVLGELLAIHKGPESSSEPKS
jgi:hypothetical protein